MNLNDLDQLVDEHVALNAFYHASSKPLRAGTVLHAKCRKHVPYKSIDGVPYEKFVEAHRPAHEVSRDCAMYSVSDERALKTLAPGRKYTYEVEPVGHVTVADFEHFAELMAEGRVLNNPDAVRSARNYWQAQCRTQSGESCTPNPTTTEYLSPALRVVRRLRRST